MEQPTRYHSLDFLRAVAMYLGVVIHISSFFGMYHPLGLGWAEYYPDPVNYQVTFGIHLFRMQFFFIIAGFFGEMVCRKKGIGYFARNRFKRIFIPFIVGCILVVPFCDALINTYNGELSDNWYLEKVIECFFFEFLSEPGNSSHSTREGAIAFTLMLCGPRYLLYCLVIIAIPDFMIA